jgi:hypothetical protein
MKSVCLKCNRPFELHQRVTAEIVEQSWGATYHQPVITREVNSQGRPYVIRSPISRSLIGSGWMEHEPLMSTKPITWATPFGTSEV